tara:strand:- start:298 stop:756 length:459 start_codon:yes stop_codon:yes gene_type:complete
MEENKVIEQYKDRRNSEDQSRSVGKIATALAKVQREVKGAQVNAKNPFFKNNYADLYQVINSCKDILAKYEIAFVQSNRFREGIFLIVTKLVHSSGEWFSSEIAMPIPKSATPQQIGSLQTYGRRYGLSSMVGIAQFDDDASASSQNNNPNK